MLLVYPKEPQKQIGSTECGRLGARPPHTQYALAVPILHSLPATDYTVSIVDAEKKIIRAFAISTDLVIFGYSIYTTDIQFART